MTRAVDRDQMGLSDRSERGIGILTGLKLFGKFPRMMAFFAFPPASIIIAGWKKGDGSVTNAEASDLQPAGAAAAAGTGDYTSPDNPWR